MAIIGGGFIPGMFGRGRNAMTLTATTVGDGDTVTIHRMTPVGGNITIDWGDGSSEAVAPGDTANKTNTYASAGTYNIRISPASRLQQIDVHDGQLSGVDTNELRAAAITYWRCYNLGGAVESRVRTSDMASWDPTTWRLNSMPAGTYDIDSADMASWTPTTWQLYSMPAGTYDIDSADMASWDPTTWQLNSMPAGTYDINSADMASWDPTNWQLGSMPAGTYDIDSADMTSWDPTNWYLYSMPAGTYDIDSADMASWDPTDWRLFSVPAGTLTVTAAANFSGWTSTATMLANDLSLAQAAVDDILYGMYQASAAPRTGVGGTINVGGTNAPPSGTYQAATACPVDAATPGKEIVHELLNDGCGVGFNAWTTVTFTP
jgi:hypothetical protein